MSTVDNRIVHMTFDNSKFERDVRQSIRTLDDLKKALDFSGVKKGFEDIGKMGTVKMAVDTTQFNNGLSEMQRGIQKITDQMNFGAANKGFGHLAEQTKNFNMNGMASAISGISGKFLAMSTLAVTALATIASKVVTVGFDMATAFSTDPIIQGFQEMETNMNSIQTILANTASKGSTLDDVNAALAQLNEYSDKTIYNFSQMARNIGTFTAAGVDLDTSVNAIKGIANLAAISGSNSEQASTAMYQLSQALATGSVKLMDWNSVVNAGMGGEVFKNALFETGKALGTIADVPLDMTLKEWEDAGNNFRESLQDGWITGDVLTTTLQSFTGDLTAAQLMSLGYTEEQAVEMEKLGKLGVAAATEVKTLTQLLSTVKETMGSGWSKTFQIIFGDFNEAKAMFTDFNNIIGEFVTKGADARNRLLEGWKDLGGRTRLIEGVKAAFQTVLKVIDTISKSFHTIFGRMDPERLYEITDAFADFFENINNNNGLFRRIRAGFDSLFFMLDFGKEVVREVINMFRNLFDHFAGGNSDKMLEVFDKITKAIRDFHQRWVDDGDFSILYQEFSDLTDTLIAFGDKVVEVFNDPQKFIDELKESFMNFFDGIDFSTFDGVEEAFGRIRDKISEVLSGLSVKFKLPEGLTEFFESFKQNVDENTTNSLAGGFGRVSGALETVWDTVQRVWDVLTKVDDVFGWIWDRIKQVGDIAGDVFGAIWDFATHIGPVLQDAFMSEEFDKFLDLLDTVGVLLGGKGLSQLGANSSNIGANFGANFGLGGVQEALNGFTSAQGIIPALKTNLDQLTSTLQTMQTQIRANALLDIAKALALLTASVLVLSFINPEDMAKSLTALAVGMGQLIGAVAILNASSGKGGFGVGLGLASLGATMILVATSVLVLSAAVAVLAQLSWDEIGRGLAAVTGLMALMVGSAKLLSGSSASLIAAGAGMVAIAVALTILGGAMKIFATLSWEDMGKGLATVAGLLVAIAGAMHLMPAAQMVLIAPSLIAIATALSIMGGALLIFASMTWEEIGKGMAALAGGLIIIAGALQLMPLTSILSGPALIAVATAMVILSSALKSFATMSWEEIGKAMATLGGSLLILAGGLTLMQGAIPGAIALGIASVSLLILGKALKGFAAVGWKELGKGLAVMAISLGALALSAMLIQPAIPAMLLLSVALLALGAGFALIGVGAALLAEAFQIIAAAGTAGIDVLMYAFDQLVKRLPEMLAIVLDAIILFAQQLIDAFPPLIDGLSNILESILDLLIANIPKLVEVVYVFIKEIVLALEKLSPDLVRAGFKIIMDLLHGIEDNATELTDTVATIIERLIRELTNHVPDLMDAASDLMVAFIQGMANHLENIITAGVDILKNLIIGILENIDDIAGAVGDIVVAFVEAVIGLYSEFADAGTDAFVEFLDGMGDNAQDILKACARLIGDILDGLLTAALILANRMLDVLIALMDGLTEAIDTHDEEINRASKDLAWAIVNGIITAVGLKSIQNALWNVGKKIWNDIKSGFEKAAGIFSPSKEMYDLALFIPAGAVLALNQDKTTQIAAGKLADRTLDSFQSSIEKVKYALQSAKEFNPTITPVLDLSQVQATAGQVAGLLGQNGITAGVSVDQANALAAEAAQAQDAAETTSGSQVQSITYEQNNYSPEALNTAKIYRQTRSLIVMTQEKELETV